MKGKGKMDELKIMQCKGEGGGSCKMCWDNGKWNKMWMCFLYKIEGYDGCYCGDCVKKIKKLHLNTENADSGTTPDVWNGSVIQTKAGLQNQE